MAEVIRMPRLSDTMEEGTIISWLKKVGDKVSSGDILAEVETDKATMELENYEDGTILHIGVAEGDSVPVDAILVIVGDEGEDYKSLLEDTTVPSSNGKEETTPAETSSEPQQEEPAQPENSTSEVPAAVANGAGNGRLKASPLAKKIAQEKGIDLSQVTGTGDEGRIIKRDVEAYQPVAAPAASAEVAQVIQLPKVVGEESFEELKVSNMRKTIAKRLGQSKFSAPHFYLTIEINMDKVIEARKGMNEIASVKISFNDIIIKAVAASLRQHPYVNGSWLGDTIRLNHHVHIGVAVAVDEGLLVPVVRFADSKSLSHIATEVKELAGKARNRKLSLEEMQGGTFSISNLGMFGIEEFTAIINPPESCIMAVGNIRKVPVYDEEQGELTNTNVMKVTMSCDHRVVDGATGAKFLQTFKSLLEDPVRILI